MLKVVYEEDHLVWPGTGSEGVRCENSEGFTYYNKQANKMELEVQLQLYGTWQRRRSK